MLREEYLEELDCVLEFAVKHTDEYGRMVVGGEIDCKDSGWLVLGGVIRLGYKDKFPVSYHLEKVLEKWTYASVNVNDRRSAWTTFAILYAMFLSGGRDGFFYNALHDRTVDALNNFINQIDMQFLYEASKNYHVAAGIIDTLRVCFGYIPVTKIDPDDNIKVMLDAYLGDGFFNDDDSRGSSLDRRVDAYSAEIIGLLLHYDEINHWKSRWHSRIINIVREFCDANLYLIDSRGEYAKWGRSLRGEAEAKKLFIWEFAERHGLVSNVGDGVAACSAQLRFFKENGIGADGQVFRDKGGDSGIWDEYTTHVQAQGYGAYGLAMALHFSGDDKASGVLPSCTEDYVKYFPGPKIVCVNNHVTGIHCVIPLANRLTKLMYLWHNRITGKNNVSVDMSPKFMPIPYFGSLLPSPYADSKIPFLPLLESDGRILVPRNLDVSGNGVEKDTDGSINCTQRFRYCKPAEFDPMLPLELTAKLRISTDSLEYRFEFKSVDNFELPACVCFYYGGGEAEFDGDTAVVRKENLKLNYGFIGAKVAWENFYGGPSIYGDKTGAFCVRFMAAPGTGVGYHLSWSWT